MDKTDLKEVPLWIRLPGLPFKYWGEKSLFKIAGSVGNVVKMDQAAKNKDKLAFARVMVEVGINQELPDEVTFCIEHGNVVKQKIKYE